MTYVIPLSELRRETIQLAGGKGANLGEMMHAGLPVPDGFCISTTAYRTLIAENNLQSDISSLIEGNLPSSATDLEALSVQIRSLFRRFPIPKKMVEEILTAYHCLPNQNVAVRSSATAEDLPTLSFAGQQDTFLNVYGDEVLLQAAIDCWSSLWTARAMDYRARNNISHTDLALAIVVQEMVESEVSGILFTANPLTGKRNQMVIDAAFGLGEALVSGQVEPDQYLIDRATDRIIQKILGKKKPSPAILLVEDHGADTIDSSHIQAITDETIRELCALGKRTAQHFGLPQDIEWGWAKGRLFLLQSRPITSLYPLPEGYPSQDETDNPQIWFSFGDWQVMLDPITPLGRDIFCSLAADIAQDFGDHSTLQTQKAFVTAGERLFVALQGVLKLPPGRKILSYALGAINPAAGEALNMAMEELSIPQIPVTMNLCSRLHLLGVLSKVLYTVFYYLLFPKSGRRRLHRICEVTLLRLHESLAAPSTNISERVARMVKEEDNASSLLLTLLVPTVASGQIPYQFLRRLCANIPGIDERILEVTRGLPYNETTEMDLALWHTYQQIHSGSNTSDFFDAPAAVMADRYLRQRLAPEIQKPLSEFLDRYGMRGTAEIDIGRLRWREDPTAIISIIQGYAKIDAANSPEMIFSRSSRAGKAAIDAILEELRTQPGGWFKAPIGHWLSSRIISLTGLRESPKFFMAKLLNIRRQEWQHIGEEFVKLGLIEKTEDIFFLHLWEIDEGYDSKNADLWKQKITERRLDYDRECKRRQIPHILISDGTTFYDTLPGGTSNIAQLRGTPVSPGMAEGIVRVAFHPLEAHLKPGEILVCPATDPSWTPLFLIAGGLIMEVGGLMTHGSVVAREYGIPAIVGVSLATKRLVDGQRVRLDGARGLIEIVS